MCHLRNQNQTDRQAFPNAPASRGRLSSRGTASRLHNVAGSRRRSIQDAGAAQSIWGQNDTQQRLDHHFVAWLDHGFGWRCLLFFLNLGLLVDSKFFSRELFRMIFPGVRIEKTLPETYMGPLKIKGWKMNFPFGMLYLEVFEEVVKGL